MTQSKSNTKRAPAQAPQKSKKQTHDPRDAKRTAASAQREIDYALTSQKGVVRKKAQASIEIRLKRFLSGRTLKEWRKAHGYSAHALAVELGISRAYVKSIEGGSLPASQKVIARFDALRERAGENVAPPVESEPLRKVISKYKLPASFEILAKPKRCAHCRAYFIGRTPQQKFCGTRCAKLGRKAQAQAKRKRAANALPKRSKRATAAKRKPAPPRATAQRTAPKPTNARRAVVSKTRGGKQ